MMFLCWNNYHLKNKPSSLNPIAVGSLLCLISALSRQQLIKSSCNILILCFYYLFSMIASLHLSLDLNLGWVLWDRKHHGLPLSEFEWILIANGLPAWTSGTFVLICSHVQWHMPIKNSWCHVLCEDSSVVLFSCYVLNYQGPWSLSSRRKLLCTSTWCVLPPTLQLFAMSTAPELSILSTIGNSTSSSNDSSRWYT